MTSFEESVANFSFFCNCREQFRQVNDETAADFETTSKSQPTLFGNCGLQFRQTAGPAISSRQLLYSRAFPALEIDPYSPRSQSPHMKNSIFRNPLVVGLLAAVFGAACSWICTQLFFEGAGGGGRAGGMIINGGIAGLCAAGWQSKRNKKDSQSEDTASTD